jgi:hypothetical protein
VADSFPRYDLAKIRGTAAPPQATAVPAPIAELGTIQPEAPTQRPSKEAVLLETFLDLLDRSMAVLVAGALLIMIFSARRSR